MLRLVCECGKQYRAQEQDAGKQARCKCGRLLQIPGPTPPYTRSLAALNTEAFSWESIQTPRIKTAPPPRSLGHFVLQRKLGEGAMGEVWLAQDTRLDRDVAIKILPAELRRDHERLKRFEREAKLSAQLHHPHVVSVFALGDDDDQLYLVMEYVDGGSLADAVQASGPLLWREATRVIRDAALGLAAAHALGLIHRDIKPANLLLTRGGMTKVADFGIARAQFQETELTQQGSYLGTPSYMSPEQWEGKPADARSDLYALICSYYYLLTGQPPYEADSWPALGYQHRFEPFPDPRHEVPDIPAAVGAILERGARKAPAERYSSATELADELSRLLDSQQVVSPPKSQIDAENSKDSQRPLATERRLPVVLLGRSLLGLILALVLVRVLVVAVPVIKPNPTPPPIPVPPKPNPKPNRDSAEHDEPHPVPPPLSETSQPLSPLPTITNSLGMTLIMIPKGVFQMGSPEGEVGREDDELQHRVILTKPFYLGMHEVTQAEYRSIMPKNPSMHTSTITQHDRGAGLDTGRLPVVYVSWGEAREFCDKLTARELASGHLREGQSYRLPTEAEWEYACRAESSTAYCFGNDDAELAVYGWYLDNSEGSPRPVGQKLWNRWQLRDMHGNVWEWCEDYYDDEYYNRQRSSTTDPVNLQPTSTFQRVRRGGSWGHSAEYCRSAYRGGNHPSDRFDYVGFRVVLDPPPQ